MKVNLKDLKESIKSEWQIILSGIKLIRDSQSYKLKSTHGLANQEYDDECNKIVRKLADILLKMKVYELVLSNTYKARLLRKANDIHRQVLAYREDE